jgi:hypothetical protein
MSFAPLALISISLALIAAVLLAHMAWTLGRAHAARKKADQARHLAPLGDGERLTLSAAEKRLRARGWNDAQIAKMRAPFRPKANTEDRERRA